MSRRRSQVIVTLGSKSLPMFREPGDGYGEVRAKTIAVRDLSREQMASYSAEVDDGYTYGENDKPETWGECQEVALGTRHNPCPYTSCPHHLAVSVDEDSGSIRVMFPDDRCEPEFKEMSETCTLVVADRGGATLEEVGQVLGCTRERIRQIEGRALKRLKESCDQIGMDFNDFIHGGPHE